MLGDEVEHYTGQWIEIDVLDRSLRHRRCLWTAVSTFLQSSSKTLAVLRSIAACARSADIQMQAQHVFSSKLSFRPPAIKSDLHRRLTLSVADKSENRQKIRMITVKDDPEEEKRRLIKAVSSAIQLHHSSVSIVPF